MNTAGTFGAIRINGLVPFPGIPFYLVTNMKTRAAICRLRTGVGDSVQKPPHGSRTVARWCLSAKLGRNLIILGAIQGYPCSSRLPVDALPARDGH